MAYVAPRGHAKTSTLGKVVPLHHILFGGPNRCIMVISRTQGHAVRVLNSIKNILNYNRIVRAIFGDMGKNTARKWSDTETILYNGTALYPIGSGQQVRGIFADDFRPTLLLFDDIEDKENTRTREAIQQTREWFFSEACQTIDPQVGRIFVIGTLIAFGCVVDILKNSPGWRSRWWEAIPGWEGDETNPSPVLWPELWPFERLMEEKHIAEGIGEGWLWWREFQNRIDPKTESLADTKNMKKIIDYNVEQVPGKEYKLLGVEYPNHDIETKIPVHIFAGIDPAASVSQGADYSVMFDLARAADRDFAIDMFRQRIRPMFFADQIIERNRRFRYNGVNIETIAYQAMLRDYIIGTGEIINGIERSNNPRHRKDERLRSLEGPLNRTSFHANSTVMQPFLDEINRFPTGDHDDTLDGCWYAYKDSYPCMLTNHDNTTVKQGGFAMRAINWITGKPYEE